LHTFFAGRKKYVSEGKYIPAEREKIYLYYNHFTMQLWIYKHYKWNNYRVIGIAKHSDIMEDIIVYQWLYDSPEFWPNPLRVKEKKLFEQTIEIDGKQVKRFTYIWE